MDLTQYRARMAREDPSQELIYEKDLPKPIKSHIVELEIKSSQKRRLVAFNCLKDAEHFRNLFNLVSCYRLYLHPDKEGHPFINKWVREYNQNKGELRFDSDLALLKNDLKLFAKENDAITCLVIPPEALDFGQESAEESLRDLLTMFTGDSVSKLVLIEN